MAQLGVLKNLPLMLDELPLTQPEEAFPLVHALAGGQEKDRMTSGLTLKPGTTWKSIYVAAGNRSLRGMLSGCTEEENAAVLNRMLEVTIPPNDPKRVLDERARHRGTGHAQLRPGGRSLRAVDCDQQPPAGRADRGKAAVAHATCTRASR